MEKLCFVKSRNISQSTVDLYHVYIYGGAFAF